MTSKTQGQEAPTWGRRVTITEEGELILGIARFEPTREGRAALQPTNSRRAAVHREREEWPVDPPFTDD